jgi:hypothetical protein
MSCKYLQTLSSILLFNAWVGLLPAVHASQDLCIAGFSERGGRSLYWVRWDQLPAKVSWAPGERPFPLKLHSEVVRAAAFITQARHMTNRLNLQDVLIQRVVVPKWKAAQHQGSPDEFTNQWLLAFSFFPLPATPIPSRKLRTVALLDGTFARETNSAAPAQDLEVSKPLSSALATGAGENPLESQGFATQDWPYERIHSDKFMPPQIQWDPAFQKFPLDVSAECSRAKAYLAESVPDSDRSILQYIYVHRYFPTEAALRRLGATLDSHRWHWLISFTYGPWSSQPGARHAVYMQLDGTILGAAPIREISR